MKNKIINWLLKLNTRKNPKITIEEDLTFYVDGKYIPNNKNYEYVDVVDQYYSYRFTLWLLCKRMKGVEVSEKIKINDKREIERREFKVGEQTYHLFFKQGN